VSLGSGAGAASPGVAAVARSSFFRRFSSFFFFFSSSFWRFWYSKFGLANVVSSV